MLRIYNTATRKKEEFKPLSPDVVTMYTCGMTVYSFTHIGHLKSYLTSDIACRWLRSSGYTVRQVMNVTDVGHHLSDSDDGEDKLEVKARSEKVSPWQIARKYEDLFFKNLDEFNVTPPTVIARASEHVPEMISLIKKLEERGFTYKTPVGITYDTSKFPSYATFANLDLDNQMAGYRVDEDEGRKSPWDFALWLTNKPNHIMKWESPWGIGYPGWHIECSAMSCKYLGEQIDIHTGGADHIKIHHTNEIAQSEGASGKKFVNYWMHTAFLNVDGTKMSKSLGNLYTLEDLKNSGYSPLSLRFLFLKGDYQKPFDFTYESLYNAQNELVKLWKFFELNASEVPGKVDEGYFAKFKDGLDDSFNTSKGITVLWELINDKKIDIKTKLATAFKFDETLGLKLQNARYMLSLLEDYQNIDALDKQKAQLLLSGRDTAKAVKDYAKADAIRKEIDELGFVVEDTKNGSLIRIKQYGKV
ncbi:MAG: cysteine--tRNA ligase [Christensenellaceae bacterium]|jgi:cysteinyl-tRNA synthetase|nr:cysteine--tRNA ligase [Christensenellaceae bacterium]